MGFTSRCRVICFQHLPPLLTLAAADFPLGALVEAQARPMAGACICGHWGGGETYFPRQG